MNNNGTFATEKIFLSNPQIIENISLLQKIGVIQYVDSLNSEIRNYKNLFRGALDIFNRTTVNDIMDAAVRQISDHFLPSLIVFIWANNDDILIKGYRNYKPIDLNLNIDSLAPFDSFFRSFPQTINYAELAVKLEPARVFKTLNPEIVIPVPGPSGLYGLVLAGSKIMKEEYHPVELVYVQELMSLASQAIQNHLHYEQALRDKAGLFNNFYFMTRLNDEIARVHRNNTCASVLMVHADRFKNFSNTHGRLAGDKILDTLSMIIKNGVRTEDVPSRFGKEEFTVLLPDSDKHSAWAVAERLRISVAGMNIPWDPPLPQVTVSIGICAFSKDAGMGATEIIGKANEAMFISKERGRNRTTVWGAGLMTRIQLMNLGQLSISRGQP